jgi:two-component system OmpR family response regulator
MRPLNILVVDDEPIIATMINVMLSAAGYEVEFVSNAAQGLERIRAKSEVFDLLLIDCSLGQQYGGVEFVRHARGLKSDMPIVVLCDHEMDLRTAFPQDAIPDAFLRKPDELAELTNLVARTLLRYQRQS